MGLNCSHRLTSLAYGRVEDGGIRCPFHGWLYDIEGKCLQQPAEPDSNSMDKVRHTAYPCRELGGLIFAYLGPPEKIPLLPRYEVLIRQDGSLKVDKYQINSNYLQNVEGALDTVHFSYLHMDHWSKMKKRLAGLPKPKLEFHETDYGIWQKSWLPDVSVDDVELVYGHFFMPAGFNRVQEIRQQRVLHKFQSWFIPMDDTHTMRFQASFIPMGKDGKPFPWGNNDFAQPGPENDYFRDYESADTISGIPMVSPGSSVKGFLSQDSMVNETQGPIVDRTKEHLGLHDKILSAMRTMCLVAIDEVRRGRDPKHIIRDKSQNELVCVRGTDDLEMI